MYLAFRVNKTILASVLAGLFLGFALSYLSTGKENVEPGMEEMNFTVVVDPGHGGIDTGASYGNIHEKDINLAAAKELAYKLKKANINSVLTRTEDKLHRNDRSEDIKYRPEVVRKKAADLLISIHVNNFSTPQPSGSQVFYSTDPPKSRILAETIDAKLTALRDENDREIMPGDYYVINKVNCPAVLIEIGFLSNPEDRRLMQSQEYQERLAEAITAGIIEFFSQELTITGGDKRVTGPVSREENIIYFIRDSGNKLELSRKELSVDSAGFFRGDYRGMEFREVLVRSALKRLQSPGEKYQSVIPETITPELVLSGPRLTIDFPAE
ncbi:MAG: N-acetylmuramoyl-L-alanine amidase family protein, partial [Halanaerobiales bacterium]